MTAKKNWTFKMTPVRKVLIGLSVICLIFAGYRLAFGLGSSTNLNDRWPWGLWIGFDVLTGVALAGGGYSTALIVHILHRDRFNAIARSAMLTSLLGYVLVMGGLFLDIGRWFNFWRPFVSWGYHSVLFEVFWCVSIYTTVQVLEFSEIATEKVLRPFHKTIKKIMPALLIIGVVLPTLHQSSLGGLYVIEVGKLHPLWWSMLLPPFFLMSSFFVGPAMISLETSLAGKAYNHEIPLPVMRGLIKISGTMMIIYLALKMGDLIYRDAFRWVFSGTLEGNMFLLEIVVGVMIPIVICFSKLSSTRKGLVTFGALTVFGVILNRMNVVFTGMSKSLGGHYFPSLMEWSVSIGMVSIGVLAYMFLVENFSVLEHHPEHQASH